MEKIILANPIKINNKVCKELTYDTDAITVGMFAEAEALKLKATTKKGGGAAGAFELDYAMQMYLGMMGIIAVNPEIDVTDLERITGKDVMQLVRVGRNFISGKSAETSEENNSGEQSEITPEPSTPPSETSKTND